MVATVLTRTALTSTVDVAEAVHRVLRRLSSKSAAVIASVTMMKITARTADRAMLTRCGMAKQAEWYRRVLRETVSKEFT